MPFITKGFFLTVEGIEGVGKSTAVSFIQQALIKEGKNVLLTREPGGTPLAEKIRQILLAPNNEENLLPETELLLMFASRIQHIQHVILPALNSGKWVISDRFVDASFAYQGGGRRIQLQYIDMLEKWLVFPLRPNVTILLDAPAEVGLARAKNRGAHDRIEMEKIDFFERVRAVYLAQAKENPVRFYIIDATQTITVVQNTLQEIIQSIINRKECLS